MATYTYPVVRRDESLVESLHGVEVKDPYRWLEDPDAEETKQFVEAQNGITMPYIESCPDRDRINKRLTALWDFPKFDCPRKRGDKYYFKKNSGLQNQAVMYVQDSLTSEPRVFLDPNTLSSDGTTALSTTSFSEDGKWFAYALSDAGSDWVRIKVKDTATGNDLSETLTKVKFTNISWTHDNLGFFYCRYPQHEDKADGTETVSNENQKVYYHRINTSQDNDVLVVEFPEKPKWMTSCEVSDCGKYIHVMVREGCHDNAWYYTHLPQNIDGKFELKPIVEEFSAEYEYVTNEGSLTYIRTNKGAPNYRLVRVDLNKPEQDNWEDIVPENKDDVFDWAHCVNQNVLACCYIRHVANIIELRKLDDGSLIKQLDCPIGTITSFTGKKNQSEIFYYFTSFLTPGTIYHYDLAKHEVPQVHLEVELEGFDANEFKTEQVFYPSKDGTKIPMFVVHSKNVELDGSNPCLLYAYGGFNISNQPYFSVSRLLFIKNFSGIFALANIRGGGEYGQKWHDGGRLMNKQNCFDDFVAAGEYLIEKKYTSKEKLVIQGGSNGGLLVGACCNQRPDLFAAGIAHVGVMDMLRFHKFTIGYAWMTDYGNPDESEHFNNLVKISPVHNIPKDVTEYPAMLLLTADHDDRVVPLHSLKFIAELQHQLGAKVKDRPLMIRVDVNAGHGAGKPTAKTIEEITDIYCFIEKSLNIKYSE
ncbi:Prolyl endopeptidase [Halotydeus destructor]|nr:Prolyl endopeptidase [Halotydeus destructor]